MAVPDQMARRLLYALAALAALAPASAAGEEDKGILTLQFENDVVADSDGQFSHGMRIAWMAPADHVPDWARRLARSVPRSEDAAATRIVYSLGQSIFTPDDISIAERIEDDRPYAGWLYGAVGLVSVGNTVLDNVELSLGVVGPASLAEDTQTAWHEWFRFQRPEGWDNQLENEPAVQLQFERAWHVIPPFELGPLKAGVTPHVGVALGNVLTQGAVGVTLRLGEVEPKDYGPPRIRPSLPGSDYFADRSGFGWYLFAGAEGRAVGRNIFLDGNTFRDSHSVDKKPFVADLQAGLVVFFGGVRLAYTHVLRTKEFDAQDAPGQFGAFSASFRF